MIQQKSEVLVLFFSFDYASLTTKLELMSGRMLTKMQVLTGRLNSICAEESQEVLNVRIISENGSKTTLGQDRVIRLSKQIFGSQRP